MSYDIIIVGAGTAGMACAIEAAQRGAQVLVVEKSEKVGGALHWSGGHMSAGGTQLQKRKNIDDSIEDHYQDIVRINGGSGDLALTRLAVELAPDTIDWLDNHGFEFAPEAPRIIYGHVPYTKARTQYGVNKAMSIYEVMNPMWEAQIGKGKIKCLFEHRFVDVEIGENSHRIVCENEGGKNMYESKQVVITTGGYGSNPDYFSDKHPGIPLSSSTYPMSTGDGHQILETKNIAFRFSDLHLPSVGGVELEPGSGRCNFNEAWANVLTSIYRKPKEIYINIHGKRFMNEDETNADTREREVVKQDAWKLFAIFDEEALMELESNGMENPLIINWSRERIKKEAQSNKAIKTAESLEELAKMIQVPVEQMVQTVETFNQYVDAGEDPDFGRETLDHKIQKGPFYALEIFASVLVTFGGVPVNGDLALIDKEGKAIQGLYGAGELLGLGATSGGAFCSGMAITPAIAFGRYLGKNLCS